MTGCRCRECYGLAEYMRDLTGRDYGLPSAPGHHTLRVVTPGTAPPEAIVDPVVVCDGSYVCGCLKCVAERRELVQAAARRNAA